MIYGLPTVMVSDNGPSFASKEFEEFLQKCTIRWKPSSPYYPKSNGLAERTIQTIKNMIHKSPLASIQDIVLSYNTTPTSHGWCSSEKFYGRPVCSFVWASTQWHSTNKTQIQLKKKQQIKDNTTARKPTMFYPNQQIWIKHTID